MRVLYYAVFVLMFVFTFTFLSLNNGNTQKSIKGKIILRLHYRERKKSYLNNPYTIGIFEFEHKALYSGDFVGTDWDGNIYIFDPINVGLHVLKSLINMEYFGNLGILSPLSGAVWQLLRTAIFGLDLDGLLKKDRTGGLLLFIVQAQRSL